MTTANKENIEYYRKRLEEIIRLENVDISESIIISKQFSVEERFYIAKELLTELSIYLEIRYDSKISNHSRVFANQLLEALDTSKEITREDYLYVIDNCSLTLLKDYVITNSCFPIDMLVDDSTFESHASDLFFIDFKWELEDTRSLRYREIIAYCKSIIPGSEHMADDMVLAISGANMYED